MWATLGLAAVIGARLGRVELGVVDRVVGLAIIANGLSTLLPGLT